jgi:hypothetical protein
MKRPDAGCDFEGKKEFSPAAGVQARALQPRQSAMPIESSTTWCPRRCRSGHKRTGTFLVLEIKTTRHPARFLYAPDTGALLSNQSFTALPIFAKPARSIGLTK